MHRRPTDGEGDHVLRFGRAMLWPRLLGIAIVLAQASVYRMVHPALLFLVVGLEAPVVVSQRTLLGVGVPRATLRRRVRALLIVDLVFAYLGGALFTPDAAWIAYLFYPLLSLEATLIAGAWAGVSVTGMSVVVYLAQLVLHIAFGHEVELRSALAAVSLLTATGGVITIHAHLAGRGQDQMRTLLGLTSELARHESQVEAMRHIDRRLHAAIGAHVRSVAVRDVDGWYRVTRWQTGDERTVSPEQMLRVFGDVGNLTRRLEAGDAVTVETDPWSLVTAALELPEWASAITLVPIVAEGRWVGMLPVLWPSRTVPDTDQLRLLHGLAGQIGLSLARGELEQMRRNATVDPVTGLLNRRAIGAELESFVARCRRSGAPLALLLMELERQGPATDAADASLRSVAAVIRRVLRTGDVAGRQDDDRLMVIAADADADAARSLARRIAGEVAALPGPGSLRLAIGVAAFPVDGPTAADMLDAAEAGLATTVPHSLARPTIAEMVDDAAGDAGEAALA